MLRSILLFFVLFSCLPAAPLSAQSVQITYRANDENFPNPDRGFYYQTA